MPGTYGLTADLICNAGASDAIDIRASGVGLKLNGHLIDTVSVIPSQLSYLWPV